VPLTFAGAVVGADEPAEGATVVSAAAGVVAAAGAVVAVALVDDAAVVVAAAVVVGATVLLLLHAAAISEAASRPATIADRFLVLFTLVFSLGGCSTSGNGKEQRCTGSASEMNHR